MTDRLVPTTTHWGSYLARVSDDRLVAMEPHPMDPDPSPIGTGIVAAIDDAVRIRRPMARLAWLRALETGGDRGRRGAGPFVELGWDEAIAIGAAEIDRVRTERGNAAIFGGSYGWGSAGRFHHPQSQIHRFLTTAGGYTASRDNYSCAALNIILPYVVGYAYPEYRRRMPTWDDIRRDGSLVVAFGGLAVKNTQVNSGGLVRHTVAAQQRACKAAGVDFVNVSPQRGDVQPALDARWLPVRPSTDVALMLGLAHEIVVRGRHDEPFLRRCCVGWDVFEAYLLGRSDGVAKSAAWAAAITGVDEAEIAALAGEMVERPTVVMVSWSVQRARFGEQPNWMGIVLAAVTGWLGRPGGGYGGGYGSTHQAGTTIRRGGAAGFGRARNPVREFIPVARIADMLLHPGTEFDYDGGRHVYPDVRLVQWCGGNPFHHHQDLNRLVAAWQVPETVIVHEPWWNALARHADLVFPSTVALERDDIGSGHEEPWLIPMPRAVEPPEGMLSDYEVFRRMAEHLGCADDFADGLGEREWVERLYAETRDRYAGLGLELPGFAEFWERGEPVRLLAQPDPPPVFADVRSDPDAHPVPTPSGRIEIFSERIAGYGYPDCPPHPMFLAPGEWLGAPAATTHPIHLVSNQPATRLHSQLDNGGHSRASKVAGREPVLLNRADARERGIDDGDVVRLFNDRGQCLAGAVLTDDLLAGVAVLATGAWFDPSGPDGLEVHGNPNVLTADTPTSRLAQGTSAQTALVQVERLSSAAPPVTVFTPPQIVAEMTDRPAR